MLGNEWDAGMKLLIMVDRERHPRMRMIWLSTTAVAPTTLQGWHREDSARALDSIMIPLMQDLGIEVSTRFGRGSFSITTFP
jgi:hypothetical protein